MRHSYYKDCNFLSGSYQLVKNKVMQGQKTIGILKPSVMFGEAKDGRPAVSGTGGTYIINDNKPDSIWEGLIRAHAILLGSEKEVEEISKLLENPITSRNSAYLVLIANDCYEMLNFHANISNAIVCFIGCGGIGSITSVTLAGLGVKKIKLIDFDLIEESNLNRQLFFTKDDIGKSKVEVLQERIKERYPHVEVETAIDNCSSYNTLEKYIKGSNLVVFTADDPIALICSAVNIANDLGVKFISAGYILEKLKVAYLTKYKGYQEEQDIIWIRRPGFIAPSYGPSNVEVAGVTSSLAVLALCDKVQISTENMQHSIRLWDSYSHWLCNVREK